MKITTQFDTMTPHHQKQILKENKAAVARNIIDNPTYRIITIRKWINELKRAARKDK